MTATYADYIAGKLQTRRYAGIDPGPTPAHLAAFQWDLVRWALMRGHVAIEEGRRFVGVELKRAYYEQAVRNLEAVTRDAREGLSLFGGAAAK